MLKALIKKQFLELNTFYFLNKKTGKSRSKFGIFGTVLIFVLLFASIGASVYAMSSFLADTFFTLGLDWLYFAFTGLLAIVLGVFGGVFNTYAGLYHAKDNELLLSMPIPPSRILLARMIGVYAMGLLYEAIVLVPSIICYWVKVRITFLNVLFPILMVFIVGFLVLSLICILGWVVAMIAGKLKNKSFITVLASLIFFAIYYFFYFKLSSFLQELVSNAVQIGATVRRAYPVYLFGQSFCGKVLPMLAVTAVIALVFVLTYRVLSKSFIKIATTKQTEKKAEYKENKAIKESKTSRALLKREYKRLLSSPTYMLNCGLGIVIMPLATVMVLIKMNALRQLMDTASSLIPWLGELIPVFASCIVCTMISMNDFTAPSISLEGKSIWILQSMPIDTADIFNAKTKLHIQLNVPPAVILSVVLGIVIQAEPAMICTMTAFPLIFTAFAAELGLSLNLLKPNLSWTNEVVPIKQGISVMISLFGCWVISLLVGLGSYLCFKYFNLNALIYMVIQIVIFAIIRQVIHSWLYKKGKKIFENL